MSRKIWISAAVLWFAVFVYLCYSDLQPDPHYIGQAKILSIGPPNRYGNQWGMVEFKDTMYKTNLGNTGFYKVGMLIDAKSLERSSCNFFLFAMVSLLAWVGFLLVQSCR